MQRYYTAVQGARRRKGRLIAIPALVALVAMGVVVSRAGRTNWPLFIASFVVPLTTAVVWGTRRALEARDYFEVDLAARRWVACKDGIREAEQPLESIAPLQVCLDWDDRKLTALAKEYFIHPNHRVDLAFLGFARASQANTALEGLALRWQVDSTRYLGDARKPGQINLPLHERLAGDANAVRALAIVPAWGFTMQPLSPGYRFTFTRPSPTSWLQLAILAGWAVLGAVVVYHFDLIGLARAAGPVWSRVALGVGALVVLGWLANVRYGIFLAWPGSLVITPTGISIRGSGSSMTFAELEEITSNGGLAFIADGRTMTLPRTWFPSDAGPMLRHEVIRAILETAPYAKPSKRG
jgi:hypothetical protein